MKKLYITLMLGVSINLIACGGSTVSEVNTSGVANSSAIVAENSQNTVVDDIESDVNTEIAEETITDDTEDSINDNELTDEEANKILLEDGIFTQKDLNEISRNSEASKKGWAEYEKAKKKSAKLKDFEFEGIYVTYNGKVKIDAVTQKGNNVLYIKAKDNSDELSIGVYDKSFNETGWQAIIDKNHKHEDSAGNEYYSAEHNDGGASFYAYEDGTLIVFTYETGDLLDNVEIHK